MKKVISDIIVMGRGLVKGGVDDTIEQYVDELDKYIPDGAWGYVKNILTFLVGNKLEFVTRSFVDSVKKKDLGSFYIDTRVKTKPVSSGWSMGKVNKKLFYQSLENLKKSL